MTRPRSNRRKPTRMITTQPAPVPLSPSSQPPLTGRVFLSEDDKRILQKFNKEIVNKLGIGSNRSVKV